LVERVDDYKSGIVLVYEISEPCGTGTRVERHIRKRTVEEPPIDFFRVIGIDAEFTNAIRRRDLSILVVDVYDTTPLDRLPEHWVALSDLESKVKGEEGLPDATTRIYGYLGSFGYQVRDHVLNRPVVLGEERSPLGDDARPVLDSIDLRKNVRLVS
jgi:hypothetical protein